MFKNNSLDLIDSLSGLSKDNMDVFPQTALGRAVYRELRPDEPDSIEELFEFYNSDKSHEDLMETLSSELAMATSGLISKVQNELLEVVDSTFSEVTTATKDMAEDIVTHRVNMVPEVKFFDSNLVLEISSIDISSLGRLKLSEDIGPKFMERTSLEILGRIAKSMSRDSFEVFSTMINLLKVDMTEIYNSVVRAIPSKNTPLQRMGPLGIPYTYLQAVIGYHIVKSLIDDQDEDTRVGEMEYNLYTSSLLNNLLIRYKSGINSIIAILESDSNKLLYKITDGFVIDLTVYEPTIKKIESGSGEDRNLVITNLLSAAVTKEKGGIAGVPQAERYDAYRRSMVAKARLNRSSAIVTELHKSFETFIASRHFDTWYDANYDGGATPAVRTKYLTRIRSMIGSISVSTDDDLYGAIVRIVCEALYDKPGIQQFISDIRVVMEDGATSIHEAIGIAADRLIMKYLVDMLKG